MTQRRKSWTIEIGLPLVALILMFGGIGIGASPPDTPSSDEPKKEQVRSTNDELTKATHFVPSVGPAYECPTELRSPVTLDFGTRTYKVGDVSGSFSETEHRSREKPDEVSTGKFSIVSPKLRYTMIVTLYRVPEAGRPDALSWVQRERPQTIMIDFVDTTAASLAEYWNNGEGWWAHREADKPKSFNVESVDCQLQGSAPPQKSTTVTNFVPTVGPIYTCPTKLRQPITLDFGKKTFAIKARRISGQWTEPGGSAGASEIGAHMMMFSAPELGDSIVVSILETFRPEIPTNGLPENPLPTLFTFAREDGKPDLPALDWIAKEWPQSIRVAIYDTHKTKTPAKVFREHYPKCNTSGLTG